MKTMEEIKALITILVGIKSEIGPGVCLGDHQFRLMQKAASHLEAFIDPIWFSLTEDQKDEIVEFEIQTEQKFGVTRPAWGSILDLCEPSLQPKY
tara:strand:+ start:587 stop:871 length:285 start_codon:yes stop_codon:yes gene_type:complete